MYPSIEINKIADWDCGGNPGPEEDRRAWDGRQEGMRGAGRQQGRILCLPEPPKIIEADSPRGAGVVRRGHLLRQQSQILVEADRRRASQDRHRRERQDRAAHDGEEGAGILQGPQEARKGRKGLRQRGQCLGTGNSPSKRGTACGAATSPTHPRGKDGPAWPPTSTRSLAR